MSDYWHGLVNYKRKKGLSEQIQEDIITYCDDIVHEIDYDFNESNVDDLCQIVVNNFKESKND